MSGTSAGRTGCSRSQVRRNRFPGGPTGRPRPSASPIGTIGLRARAAAAASTRSIRAGAPQSESSARPTADTGCTQVAGIVEAWGTVEVHEDGFRAEYARPLALILPRKLARTDVGAVIEQLATRYGCQVLELDGDGALHAYCERHNIGLSVPVVRELLAPKREAAEPVGTSSAAAGRRERAGTMLTYALGGLWWLFWLGVAVAIVYGIAAGVSEEQDKRNRAEKDHRRLELVEQSLVDLGGGESLYIAVVKNRSRTKTASWRLPERRLPWPARPLPRFTRVARGRR